MGEHTDYGGDNGANGKKKRRNWWNTSRSSFTMTLICVLYSRGRGWDGISWTPGVVGIDQSIRGNSPFLPFAGNRRKHYISVQFLHDFHLFASPSNLEYSSCRQIGKERGSFPPRTLSVLLGKISLVVVTEQRADTSSNI